MNKKSFTTHIFNFRLFLEGLKRLRVTTMALGIVTLAISALVPIVAFLESSVRYDSFGNPIITEIKFQTICVPASLAVLTAPIFFLVMFSFLQKRKQSDFFHAIPYTRTCVYLSFTAAALVSIFAIQLAAGLAAGILWGMVPYTTFEVAPYIGLVFANLLGSLMLSAFMMLSLTVSGTGGSSCVLFLLFAALPRIVLCILISYIRAIPVMDLDYWIDKSFFSPVWFYPLASVGSSISSVENMKDFLFHPATIIYSILVSILIFTVAGFLYDRRQSEMAGNPARGKKTQALFRILFALPLALVTTTLVALNSTDGSLILVLLVLTALCYFLYELVTTKRAANMGKAIPGFVLLLGISIAFSVIAYFSPTVYIQGETVTAETVESVTVTQRMLTADSYGSFSQKVTVKDPEIISILSNAYNRYKQNEKLQHGTTYEVTFEKTNGRKLHRRVYVTGEEKQLIAAHHLQSADPEEYRVPKPSEVYNVSMYVKYGEKDPLIFHTTYKGEDAVALLSMLDTEINALSKDVRPSIIGENIYETKKSGFLLTINAEKASYHYIINEQLPKTHRYLLGYFVNTSHNQLAINGNLSNEVTAADILTRSINILRNDTFIPKLNAVEFYLKTQSLDTDHYIAMDGDNLLTGEELAAVLEFLAEHQIVVDPTGDIPVPEPGYEIWYLQTDFTFYYSNDSKNDYIFDGKLHMAFAMEESELETLKKLLNP